MRDDNDNDSGRKRKSRMAAETEPLINKKQCLTIRTKTTASTGAKRIAKPKEAVTADAASPVVAEILSSMKKKRTLSTGQKRTTKPKKLVTYTVQGVLNTFSETTEYGRPFRGLTSEGQLADWD